MNVTLGKKKKKVKLIKNRRRLYLGERFLCVSEERSLPGEQPGALYRHRHVSQFELNEVKNS